MSNGNEFGDLRLSCMLHPRLIRQMLEGDFEDRLFSELALGHILAIYPEPEQSPAVGRRRMKAVLATIHFFHLCGIIHHSPRDYVDTLKAGTVRFQILEGSIVEWGHPCNWAHLLDPVELTDQAARYRLCQNDDYADYLDGEFYRRLGTFTGRDYRGS